MAAVDTALRRPPDRSGDHRFGADFGMTAPLTWIVLVAVVIGVAIGGLACVAGLAGGTGHQIHAQGANTPFALATSPHAGHVSAAHGPGSEDSVQPAAPTSDTRPGSADPVTQSHPGMACVATIDLRVPESVAPLTAGWFDTPSSASPAECVSDLDPPVPRIS